MEHRFLNKFKPSYQRNTNSRSQTKNLRCFPVCKNGKHVRQAFCGEAVKVGIRMPKKPANAIVAYAKFGLHGEKEIDVPCRLLDGLEVRSAANLCSPWIRVEVSWQADDYALLSINPDLLGWHYGWKSNKHTRSMKHCLKLFIFDCQDAKCLKLMTQVSYCLSRSSCLNTLGL